MSSGSLSLPQQPHLHTNFNGLGTSPGCGGAEGGTLSSLAQAEAEFVKALKRLEYERAQAAGAAL